MTFLKATRPPTIYWILNYLLDINNYQSISKSTCFFLCLHVYLCVNLSLFQLHPELSALPEQHDSGGLHDGSGCSFPAGDRRSPRPQITVPRRLPGNRRKRQTGRERAEPEGMRRRRALCCLQMFGFTDLKLVRKWKSLQCTTIQSECI